MGPGDPPGPLLLRARLCGLLAAGAGSRGGSAVDRTGRRECGADPTGRARRRRGLDGGGERDARLEARTRLRARGGPRGVGGLPLGRWRSHLSRPPDAAPRSHPAQRRGPGSRSADRERAPAAAGRRRARGALDRGTGHPAHRRRRPARGGSLGLRFVPAGRSSRAKRLARTAARRSTGARAPATVPVGASARPRCPRRSRSRRRWRPAAPSSCRRQRARGVSTWRRAIRHGSLRRRPPAPGRRGRPHRVSIVPFSFSRRAGTSERGRTRGAPPADSAPRCAVRAAAESSCVRSRSFVR